MPGYVMFMHAQLSMKGNERTYALSNMDTCCSCTHKATNAHTHTLSDMDT